MGEGLSKSGKFAGVFYGWSPSIATALMLLPQVLIIIVLSRVNSILFWHNADIKKMKYKFKDTAFFKESALGTKIANNVTYITVQCRFFNLEKIPLVCIATM